jgi:Leucine-rich repeat (LRR) protein/GTPase SAR1 family protein
MERQALLKLIKEAAVDQRPVLNLVGFGLTELPAEIGQLHSLTSLNLENNQIINIPEEIGQLQSLTSLNLSRNQIIKIPEEIGQLQILTSLDLGNNQIIKIPEEIGQLQGLTSLDLRNNQVIKIPDEIGQLQSLNSLSLWNNQVSEIPDEIGQLQNLTSLGLWNNQIIKIPDEILLPLFCTSLDLGNNQIIRIPEEIGQLQSLTSLDLGNNQIIKIPEEIGQLQSLTSLDLGNNQIVKIPEEIGQLQSLTSLSLGNNQIVKIPEEIGQLQNLTSLGLKNNQIVKIPEEIGQLQSLTSLSLGNNQIVKIPEEIGQLQSLTSLSLNNNQISKIPKEIGQLQNLTSLSLGDNQIVKIPGEIGQLQSLTSLSLSRNQISEIPAEIGQLQSLTSLNLSRNQISEIPAEIGQLQSLISLVLKNNQIVKIPEEIGQLQSLASLNLSRNQISEIPEEIGQLQSLTSLSLGNNQISEVPEEIGQLKILISFYISFNKISEIPEVLRQLRRLSTLNLYGNQITKIPPWMQSFSNLEKLDLRGNPIPIEPAILGPNESYKDPGNLQAILSFYFQSQDSSQSAPLYEAKFIIVGEGGAGKTTLARKIQEPDCQLPSPEDRTEGIDVIRWQFTQPNGQPFVVNIWDFGGQEIYHATHQFFLTARSLYTLVIDDRRENPNFDYWLNVVRLLSDNSPIFIVKNEKQNCQCSIDEGTLRKEFDQLLPSIPTNFATNRGLDDIQKTIQTNFLNLPHINNPIPNSYLRIRSILENYSHSQDYISDEKYYELCRSQNIKDPQEQLNISQYLHDLGICLHFQKDPVLKHLLILNPTWSTNAVYRISSYEVNEIKVVAANQGRFTRAELEEIWHQSEYANMQDKLLQLMQKFGICYPIRNIFDTYIAPSLLPEDRPEYDWYTYENLILRYEYEFMPRGIITRFIVETHDLIEIPDANKPQNQMVWKKGVILRYRYARAEITEDYSNKEIRIRVVGKQRKSLLAIIRRELGRIHKSFNRLDYPSSNGFSCYVTIKMPSRDN